VADGIEAGRTKVTPAEMTRSGSEEQAPPAGEDAEVGEAEAVAETATEPELEPAAVAEGSESA
jgi:hypothetical protein